MIVDEGLSFSLKGSPFCRQLLGSVESIIGKALLYKFFSIFAVYALSLALPVWGMRMPLGSCFNHIPFCINSFIRNDAAPVKCLDYILLGPGDESLGICILYPYDEIASVLFCIEVVVKRCPDSSHVQRSCW